MNRDDLLDELTQDILAYVMEGSVSEEVLVEGIKPEGLDDRFDDYRTLVDLHFVLEAEVVEFVRNLGRHLRDLETSTQSRTRTARGTVEGRINWQQTIQRRYSESPGDRSLFVCDTRTENYDTDENVVLKHLLAVVYRAVERADEYLERDYEWVPDGWTDEENLVDELRRVFERNVHVRRIREPEQYEPTARMLTTAANSRQEVYRDAAALVEQHRAIHQGDPAAIRDLLERTTITPDDEDTLFELFVLFRFITTLESMQDQQFELRTIESGRQEVARLVGEKEIVLYHDNSADDRDLSFVSEIADRTTEDDLSRTEKVQKMAYTIANDYFDTEFDSYTGRPDVIVLEVRDEEASEYAYLITEVKNSANTGTIRTGIKETLEYLAFLRYDDQLVHDAPNYFGDGWNGLLVVQDLDEETTPLEDQKTMRILQASELEDDLERVLGELV